MPFEDGTGAPWQVHQLQLQVVDDKRFHILTPFSYVTRPPIPSAPGTVIQVPGGPVPEDHSPLTCAGCTDFASVPRPIRGILGTYGPQLAAALVHDRLCTVSNAQPKRADRRKTRDLADTVFLQAMRSTDQPSPVTPYQARLFWGGVSIVRYVKYHPVKAVVLLAQVIAGWLAILLTYQFLLTLVVGQSLRGALGDHWWTQSYVWLIPFTGALLLSAFLRSKARPKVGERKGFWNSDSVRRVALWVGRGFWVVGLLSGVIALGLALPLPADIRVNLGLFVVDLTDELSCIL